MPIGGGKYDDICNLVCEKSEAKGAAIIIFKGERGGGFSVQGPPEFHKALPDILESMAAQMRNDIRDLEAPHIICPKCKKASYSAGDIDNKFCIDCGFHSELGGRKE
jgi:hypothetical protein